MPSATETKMNLSALQQVDPEINEIVDSAAQVALFQYSTQTSQWTKSDIEGALFVYAHRNPSERGLIILNRHSPKNYKEPITADIEFKMNPPFLIYKTPAGQIYGAWFYVPEECTRVGGRCCRLVSYLKKREKNSAGGQASSEKTISILQSLLMPPNPAGPVGEKASNGGSNNSNNAKNHSNKHNNNSSNGNSSNGGSSNQQQQHNKQNGQSQGKDILSLLQRAVEDKPTKKPLAQNNNSNHNNSNSSSSNNNNNSNNSSNNGNGRKQETLNGTSQNGGHQRRSNGQTRESGPHYESSPGVPVVHKPVPTKALPPSVEQLFKSAGRKQAGGPRQPNGAPPSQTNGAVVATNGVQLIQSLSQRPGENSLDRLLSMAGSGSPTSAPHLPVAPAGPPLNDCMATILNKLNESAQKVQREQQQLQAASLEAARHSPPAATAGVANVLFGALAGGVASQAAVEKKLTLITPEMLEESLSQGAPLTPPQVQVAAGAAAAMSRTELRSALVHLLEHDDDFLTKIHMAYLQGAGRRKQLGQPYFESA